MDVIQALESHIYLNAELCKFNFCLMNRWRIT